MAGVKGKSGVYKRSAEHLNNMSKMLDMMRQQIDKTGSDT